jgi:hypothetical protein
MAESWEEMRRCRAVVPASVVSRAFAEETVVLNLQTGMYHGLDGTGRHFYEVLQEAPDLGSASAQLADDYEQPLERIEADVHRFCSDLRERGLIELSPPDGD